MSDTAPRLIALPRHADLIAACAAAVVEHCAPQLPDLRAAVILTPHHLQHRRLRRCLLDAAKQRHGTSAMLPPTIATLRGLFRQRMTPPHGRKLVTDHERRLLLADALARHPDLPLPYGDWEMSDQLLRLFDEIDAAHPRELPRSLHDTETTNLVAVLYPAWHTGAAHTTDLAALYRDSLQNHSLTRPQEHVFICGFNELSVCESDWAKQLYARGRLTLVTHSGADSRYRMTASHTAAAITGTPPPLPTAHNALEDLLTATFASDDTLADRARAIRERYPASPARAHIRVFKPDSLEQHAFGIYTRIREWLDDGVFPIAVVSADRKLSRRLRAVLERAAVPLRDAAGWALSTTTSATPLKALLPLLADDLDRNTLLYLAGSPYCHYGLAVERVQRAYAWLERQLAGLPLFQTFDEIIKTLLDNGKPPTGNKTRAAADARQIARCIHDALGKLRTVIKPGVRQSFAALFEHLREAMTALGMDSRLQQDPAGQQLLEELDEMAQAAQRQDGDGDWNLWRRWILHTLEHQHFIPKEHTHLVSLYNFPQSALARPQAMVIAALDAGHCVPPVSTLLNEQERRDWGLKDRHWETAKQFDHFRTALTAASQILLTCQTTDQGNALTPAPWLDGLQRFHDHAYADDGGDLEDVELRQRAQAEMRAGDDAGGDQPSCPVMPTPQLPALPERLSISALQNAVDCPYRFFVRSGLKLMSAAEPDAYDSPRDYGLRLHRCLAALHRQMNQPWREDTREHALKLAQHIVNDEFSTYRERHYSINGRLAAAYQAMERYVDWLINKHDDTMTFETESRQQAALEGLVLHGRLDCILSGRDGVSIIDYKSGEAPSKKSMRDGKDVQLTAYALLLESANAVGYLKMKDCRSNTLADKELNEARIQLRRRLRIFKDDAKEKNFPAWAADNSCKHCDYSGVCRRSAWRHTAFTEPASYTRSTRR